ncbi:response regulator [Paenibacillus sp. LMG 31456]|uniref:Response regulator n=1 Tax=Paenibacillus foliorum TaxID=2654974 RepID=A0A972GP62_9BACL|nr:response regulator transcription factor [Paenibacillus foliorum]NOU91638.1 response regulator [Paenibacillus foliorum]
MYKIMVVEDDDKIAGIVKEYLDKYGYDAFRATRFREIKSEFLEHTPDLVLLDINLPHYDGYYWCRQIRTVSNVPIVFLSARTGEMDQVMAIENGGDDYLTKPFHLDLVIAKVKGVLRRTYGEYSSAGSVSRDVIEVDGFYLDRTRNEAMWKGSKVELSHNEFLLLDCLLSAVDQVVTREQLLEALWDDTHFVDDNTLSVNVTRVRKKLEELGLSKVIETVRGQGYRMLVTWRNV